MAEHVELVETRSIFDGVMGHEPRKDPEAEFEDASQFVKDFCMAHRSLFPEAAIYKALEM